MSRVRAEFALPEVAATRRAFDRAAASFAAARFIHDETRERLLERLDFMRVQPGTVVDLGCATGAGARRLQARYPGARVLALDSSTLMLQAALRETPQAGSVRAVAADAERLPLKHGSVDLIFANMLLPWTRPQSVFGEAARVLNEGGLLLFATLGPDSLEQVRRAWASVDDGVHVHAFFDMHDLGDLAVASGLADPVLDVDRMELTYKDVDSMVRDLRACGAINVAAGRRRSLTGTGRWAGFDRALTSAKRGGRFSLTLELILGQAWGTGRARAARVGAAGDAAVPVADVGIIRRSEHDAREPPDPPM
jgi:malonyl-CoA O-methyltransferase